jgi:superfamily II DNA or RNA helicase
METKQYFSVTPWPHQERGVSEVIQAIKPGEWICLTSPTGGGKSKMMEAIVRYCLANNMKVDLKVNRKMLRDQLINVFQKSGIKFGVRAAGLNHLMDPSQPVQICSTPTENARCGGDDPSWEVTDADVVLVDEAHIQCGPSYVALLKSQSDKGACIIGVTATPIGISQLYSKLIIAGTNSELRACKSHVRCVVKAPFEFDLSKVGRTAIGEYDQGEVAKKIYTTAVVGRIVDEWLLNNPDQKPTLVFAPDVACSIWMAETFTKSGIPAAHIDAKQVWYDGELIKDPDGKHREKIIELYKQGEIPVITNRYVLREGIDLPAVYNLILATPFGSLKTYLQVVGRLIRYSPETPDHVLLTDHASSFSRHGSPNMDRDWETIFHMTEEELLEETKKQEKKSDEDPPITCPGCGTVRLSGSSCPEPPIGCGITATFRGKVIVQANGKLRTVTEQEMKEKHQAKPVPAQKLWDEMYWAVKNSKGPRATTFTQMRALFKKRHGYYAPFGLANMPRFRSDESKPVREVKYEDLNNAK